MKYFGKYSKTHRFKVSMFRAACFWVVGLIAGCDSGSQAPVATDVHQLITNSQMDYISAERMIASLDASTAPALLANGDFSEGVNGWSTCSGTVPTIANGQASVAPNDCLQQGLAVTPGEMLELQCDAVAAPGYGWAGMSISFYDANSQFLSEPDAVTINTGSLQTYAVRGQVPEGAAYVGVWAYTVDGATLENCQLGGPGTFPEVPFSGPLLANEYFDGQSNGQLDSWDDRCGGSVASGFNAYAGYVYLGDGACLTQSLSSGAVQELQGKRFQFGCYIDYGDSDTYGELSTNLTGELTSEPIVSYSSGSFNLYGVAAADLDNAYVSILVGGESRRIVDCYLSVNTPDFPDRPVAVDDEVILSVLAGSQVNVPDLKISHNDYAEGRDINYKTIVITEGPSVGIATVRGSFVSYKSPTATATSFKYVIADAQNLLSNEATVTIRYGGDVPQIQEVDWGACPCVDEGQPWNVAFNFPNNLSYASMAIREAPPIPTAYIGYDAIGNELGQVTLYGDSVRFEVYCGADVINQSQFFSTVNLSSYDEYSDAVLSCHAGIHQHVGQEYEQ